MSKQAMQYDIEREEFHPVEGVCGCDGCAYNGMPLYDATGNGTACQRAACFPDDFPDGHPLSTSDKPIIWIRKVAA
jgi:hypothetical protein